MAFGRSTFVAATILTFVRRTSEEPTLRYWPLSSTRSSRACVVSGNSATSSRKIVPPSASSKYPLRESTAPVKAPFSWPKSSESMVPSGMAPQFTAIYFPCLRELKAWMICGKNSLPVPLSPHTSTDRSIGATLTALSRAAVRAGALPTIPKRWRACCTAADGRLVFSVIIVQRYYFFAVRCCCSSLDLVVLNMLLFLLSLQS